jgi:hypothetical protein
MIKWTNGIIMKNRETNLELKLENIVRDGKKYNMIDRFFHYSIEEMELDKDIDRLDLTEDDKGAVRAELLSDLYLIEKTLKEDIKKSFGISDFEVYAKSEKKSIIENPALLGITPFLFNKNEWVKFMENDIKKCKNVSFYHIENIIMSSLTDTLNRLDKDMFLLNNSTSDSNIFSAIGLFSLIVDDIFEMIENSDSTEFKTNQLNRDESLGQISRIRLTGNFNTGKLIDKLIEGFGFKNIKLTDTEKKDIQSFVSQNFKNSSGKRLVFSEIKNRNFFYSHIKLIKSILVSNSKAIRCNNKEISILINKTFPESIEIKTIENY